MAIPTQADPVAGQRYLLLADISGYTAFLNGVEQAHGVDFSSGIPAGYEVLGALLDAVVEGVQPAFDIAKLVGSGFRAAGACYLLRSGGETASKISLPRPARSRKWLNVALLDCRSCHQVVERRSPVQRYLDPIQG